MEENKLTLNRFLKGVNTDIAEDLLPKDFLSGGHNIKFTNDDSKQSIVQKQESYIKELDGYNTALKPLAAKVFNDVIYIVSYNSALSYVEYGTYPSADLTTRYTNADGKEMCTKVYKYAPLPNFLTEETITATPPAFYSLPYTSAPPQISTITTGTGVGWNVTAFDAGVTPSPMSGVNGANLTMTVADNSGPAIVKTVTLESAGGGATTVINLSQTAGPFILASPDEFNDIPATNPPQMLITISTHGPNWEYVSGSADLHPVNTSGPSGYYMLVDMDDNLGGSSTSGMTIQTIEATPVQESIVFHQLAATLAVDVTDLYFDDSGQPSQNVSVTSNTTWTILKSDTWIWVTGDTGVGDDVFQVEMAPNTGIARDGTVTVDWGGVDVVINVHQTAP